MAYKTIGYIKDNPNRAILRDRIMALGYAIPKPSELYDMGLHLMLIKAERNSPNDIYTRALKSHEADKLN